MKNTKSEFADHIRDFSEFIGGRIKASDKKNGVIIIAACQIEGDDYNILGGGGGDKEAIKIALYGFLKRRENIELVQEVLGDIIEGMGEELNQMERN